ncbi:MAG TPA: glycoside hydrolase family 3 N-terminal domain-containing protein, partial [Burkholderiaceae bacterium]|nr:glycoside hydrolase family 3 N-terminal domain-containing protein [Burkholderiaceae bacterium]
TESEARRLIADLRAVLGPHALIGMDQEGGSVSRAVFLPQAPAAMALGAAGDESLAEDVGAAVARGLRSIGVNWNFAPVLDVNNNPDNPVVAERSFGADPHAVARLGAAWTRGALSEGVACCVKHFPGHGDTQVDSHHALPTVEKSLAELDTLELVPFRGVASPALMTAHIVYPRIDAEYPATLSRRLLTGVLRERLGYDGVVITDALMMKAVYEHYGHARSAVLALQAGVDMVLAQGTRDEQRATVLAITQALAAEELEPAALLRSTARLDALATRFPSQPGPYDETRRAADDKLLREAWARGLTAVANPMPPPRSRLRVVTQADVPSDGIAEAGIPAAAVRALFDAFADVEFVFVEDLQRITRAQFPRDGRFNVLVSNHRQRYATAAQRHGLSLPATPLRPDLHIVLWNPFQVLDIAAPAVVTWGYADGALAALRAWAEGRASAAGRTPVPLEPAW